MPRLRLLQLGFLGVALLSAAASAQHSLKAAAGGRFVVGTAVTSEQLEKPAVVDLIVRQFGHLTPEYEMFPQFVHPEPNQWTFGPADAVVDFAQANNLPVVGHMLVWGNFTPDWMFEDDAGNPPPQTIDDALMALAEAGYPVSITELDVDPLPQGQAGLREGARNT